MTQRPSLALHLGAHKTASTHLQQTLDHNASLLGAQGVRFIGPRHLRRQEPLLMKILADPDMTRRGKRQAASQHIAGLSDDAAARIVVSEENLLGRTYTRQGGFYPRGRELLQNIGHAFSDREIEIFYAIRQPAAMLTSAYSQSLKAGRLQAFNQFAIRAHVMKFAWSDLVSAMAGLPCVTSVTVWRYEDYGAVWPLIISQLLDGRVEADALSPLRKTIVNPSLSRDAIEQALAWKAEDPTADHKALVEKARDLFPPSAGQARIDPWTAAEQAQDRHSYDRDCRIIAGLPGVTMLAPPG